MLDAAIAVVGKRSGEVPAALGAEHLAARVMTGNLLRPDAPTAYDDLRLEAIAAQRHVLDNWCRHECIDDDAFHCLEEELDRAELNATPRHAIELLEG